MIEAVRAIRPKEGMEEMRPYTKPGRLVDVLALIQVLSLDEYTHRTESRMAEEMQGDPASSGSWTELAREHPEFFRVRFDDKNISLIARHVMSRDAAGKKPYLPTDLMEKLFQTAIDLHDRQIAAQQWFRPLVPSLIGGLLVAVPTLVTIWLKFRP
jgi:hypothetical protein